MKQLLVIGAGYIGAEVIRQALDTEWEAIGATKSGEDGMMAIDVSDIESLRKCEIAPDIIIHCASSGRGGEDAYRAVFLQGVENIHSVYPNTPLIFVSSSSVYAQTEGEVVNEQSETLPTRATGKILLESEKLVLQQGGIVARLAGIYGPKRSVLLKKLLMGSAEIEEDGRRIINQIHQYDAASALLFLAGRLIDKELAGECYNVCDSFPRSQKETYIGLCKVLNLPLPPTGVRDLNRKRGWTHKAVSNQKLISAGWTPQYPNFLECAVKIKDGGF